MIRINLLPHREEKRAARRQQFYAVFGLIAILACAIWFAGYGVINGYIGAQDNKNSFLKSQIAVLDKDIEEIKRLKEQTDALLSRKRINSRVSTMMRNLEASPLLERPNLVEIQLVNVGTRPLNQFNMDVYFTRQTTEDDKKGKAAAPVAGSAAKESQR